MSGLHYWQICPSCDCDYDETIQFVNGLCPACARERELAEAAEEELADALAGGGDGSENENKKDNNQ